MIRQTITPGTSTSPRMWRQYLRGKEQGQRGQALVEFAILSSMLFLLLAGAVDLGTLLDNHLSIAYASRQGARIGAEEDQDPGSDCAVLGSIFAATRNLTLVTVTKIIIYQSDANGNSTGRQQVYTGNPGCPSPPNPPVGSLLSGNWPPSARADTPPNEDSLGVEIDYTYSWQTGFISAGTFQGSDRTVMKLNPVF
jgi:hypothetical protein